MHGCRAHVVLREANMTATATHETATPKTTTDKTTLIVVAPISFDEYAAELAALFPPDVVAFLVDLFRHVLDGHNAHVSDGVERALGRRARDFADYARAAAAASGVWNG
jgi:hypothetical protein